MIQMKNIDCIESFNYQYTSFDKMINKCLEPIFKKIIDITEQKL